MQAKLWTKRFSGLILSQVIILLLVVRFFGLSYPDNDLLPKTYLLDKNPKLFFAGDSRAERQLDPYYAAQILHLSTDAIVNIAANSGDPLQVLALIKKHPGDFKDAILIISISANQLNDGAKDSGYFTDKMISKLPFGQQLKTFYPNHLETLTNYYTNNIKSNLGDLFSTTETDKHFEDTNGFRKVEGKFDPAKISADKLDQMPWYKDFDPNGIKNGMVRDALQEIRSRVKHLLVLSAPFAPGYIEIAKEHETYNSELEFQAAIKEICSSTGIECITYLSHPSLGDDYFYDWAHLNSEGARLFTQIILSDLTVAEKLGLNNLP